ncbi:MAG: anaerobic ribonucleoside-triphosphate reductase activating protein [Desulfotalea sp.]
MIIGGFQPLSLCDFPQTPAAVVFVQGCNLRCPFCHNQQLLPMTQENLEYTEDQILEHLKIRKKVLSAVVISGGEPTVHKDLSLFIIKLKSLGLKVKIDTNGTNPKALIQLIERNLLDYIAMDIKAPLAKYELLSGLPVQTDTISESIQIIANSTVPHHFRTTFVPHLLNTTDIEKIKASIPKQSTHVVQEYIDINT